MFGRLDESSNRELAETFRKLHKQMLRYVASATKHQARALSVGGATIRDVADARRQGDNPIGLPDGKDVLKIEKLAAEISNAVDKFRSKVKSSSGI